MKLRNGRDLPKLIDNRNNLKELGNTRLDLTRFGNTYTARIVEMGRAGQ